MPNQAQCAGAWDLPAPPDNREAAASFVSRLGFPIVWLFVLLVFSRLIDFIPQLRLAALLGGTALLLALLNGALRKTLFSRPGLLLLGFTCWLALSTPFSFWRGGSVELLVHNWSRSLAVFIMLVGLIDSVRQCRRAILAVGMAAPVVTAIFLVLPGSSADRLALDSGQYAGFVFGNPNDLAQVLTLSLPLWLAPLTDRSRARGLLRAFLLLSAVPILLLILRTGSRGALITLSVLGAWVLWKARLGTRLKAALSLLVLGPVVLLMLPDSTKARLGTLLTDGDTTTESRLIGSALSSSENRLLMLELSLKYTAHHPLLGVGPGQFREYADHEARKGGGIPLWRSKATHNSYTQVSSEAGLPAFLLYLGVLLSCLRMNARVCRQTRPFRDRAHVAAMAWSLNLSLLAYSVSTFFSSVAYHMYLPIFAGLTVALSRCVAGHLGPSRPTASFRPESTEPAKLAAAA